MLTCPAGVLVCAGVCAGVCGCVHMCVLVRVRVCAGVCWCVRMCCRVTRESMGTPRGDFAAEAVPGGRVIVMGGETRVVAGGESGGWLGFLGGWLLLTHTHTHTCVHVQQQGGLPSP